MQIGRTGYPEQGEFEVMLVGDAAEFEEAVERVYQAQKETYVLAGYETGSVPREAILAKEGKHYFSLDAINLLVDEQNHPLLCKALADAGIRAIDLPIADLTRCNRAGFEMSFRFNILPAVTLGQYQNLAITYEKPALPADAVEMQLEQMRQFIAAQSGSDVLPALDDAFARKVSACQTLDALRSELADAMQNYLQQQSQEKADALLLEQAGQNCQMTPSFRLISEEYRQQLHHLNQSLAQTGSNLAQHLATLGKTQQMLEAEYLAAAERTMRGRLAALAIAQHEGIAPTPDEVEAETLRLAQMHGKTLDALHKETLPYLIENDLMLQRVLALLRKTATITQTEPSAH